MARASSALLKRRLDIAEIVRKQGEVKVDELSELLNVSGVTIRQDLTYLEQQGYLKRSFGGAIYIAPEGLNQNGRSSLQNDLQEVYQNYAIDLVKNIVNYIQDGDTLFLSHGQLIRKLIPFLYDKKSLKIIVNDLSNAQLAKEFTQAEVIIVGGELMDNNITHDSKMMSFIISQYTISRFIIEVADISAENQLLLDDAEQVNNYRQLIKHAEQTIAILPQRSIHNDQHSVVRLKDVDVMIVTRAGVTAYHQQLLDCQFKQMDSSKHAIIYQHAQEM
ncbi:DeoR/GlpR family DNA-binding transcription regulator [Orbus mooreae]|uniref:DeoR/GlpR family DNA-binding transcription regulator n=1 Tax=Orbus mooreae TaxID=3074107 RepID=UPI00370D97E1